uniref:pentapeptide repeat-containing protein n=1 Tax=Prochlorothrix hollandica TaxID=1223 RepID=UPI00389A16F7
MNSALRRWRPCCHGTVSPGAKKAWRGVRGAKGLGEPKARFSKARFSKARFSKARFSKANDPPWLGEGC